MKEFRSLSWKMFLKLPPAIVLDYEIAIKVCEGQG